jgi:MerR family transcriptional regulator, copper efflux regulator
MPDRRMQIGEVAERCGLSLRTVRYYEEQGLIEPEARTGGGFRLYAERHVERLELIKQMKPLGFTVAEMRELLDARDALADPRADADRRAAAADRLDAFARIAAERIAELREKLAGAEAFAEALGGLTARGAPGA